MAGIFYKLGRLASSRPKLFWGGLLTVPLLYVSCGQLGQLAETVHKNSTVKSEAEIKAKARQFAEQRNAEHRARVQKKCIDGGDTSLESAKALMKAGKADEAADAIAECANVAGATAEVVAYAQTVTKAHQEQIARENKENERLIARARAEDAKRLAAEKKKQGVAVGMTKADVLASSWGRPQSINTTTTAYSVREQWVYGSGNYLYFENGVLKTIQN